MSNSKDYSDGFEIGNTGLYNSNGRLSVGPIMLEERFPGITVIRPSVRKGSDCSRGEHVAGFRRPCLEPGYDCGRPTRAGRAECLACRYLFSEFWPARRPGLVYNSRYL